MAPLKRKALWLVALIVVLGGAAPPLAYWQFVGRVPSVGPEEAKALLSREGSPAVLLDVRPAAMFDAGHIEAATNLPFDRVMRMTSRDEVPEALRGRTVLVICSSGLSSALAAARLRALGFGDVRNVVGGMTAWVADAATPCALAACTLRGAAGETTGLPLRESPLYEQWAAVLSGFVIKPAYMLLALVLIVILWRRQRPELAALRWGLAFFLAGEVACAVNYLTFGDRSFLAEYLHSFGMALCFGFVTYAAFEGMDHWLIRYTDLKETCAALPLCRQCIKYTDVPCGLRRTFYVIIPAAIVLAFMPLLAEPATPSYNTRILGALYNYSHPAVHQVYEIRYLPAVAMVLLGASLAVLLAKRSDPVFWSKLLFAAGMGALGFSFLRLFLFAPYRDNQVWFAFWEEVTELMFVAGAGIVLWIFRRGLLADTAAARAPRPEA